MPVITILKHLLLEDEEAPEFRYLLASTVANANRLFDANTVVWREWNDDTEIPESDYVLVIGKENVLFTKETLKRMVNSVTGEAGVVIPDRLSKFDLSKRPPIYTLRDIESAEQWIFQRFLKPRELNASHLPLSLFSYRTFRKLQEKTSLREIFTDPSLLTGHGLEFRPAHAGIFHQFIDYYGEPREDVLPYMPTGAQHILEIGCGRGVTGKLIQEKTGAKVTGMELNPEVAEDARKNLHNVIVGDVQTVEIEGLYDAVLATELFEHLNYPEDFLTKMKPLLNPGGRIVLTTPNVGHYSIVEDLLAGSWDYVPIGLLCYTHFRFFTKRTLEDVIERAGFSTYELIPQKTELPDKFFKIANMLKLDTESLSTRGFYVIIHV